MTNGLKPLILSFSFLFFSLLLQPINLWGDEILPEGALEGIDAFQALEIANEWKWSNKEIKSSVYPKTIVFKFPNGRIKRILLPDEKMVVAVAPYINNTHK
jgi:hypothetical protein